MASNQTKLISEESVERGTGKPYSHWKRVLERFDVAAHGHKAAAEHLLEHHGISPWWSQMVTVRFEQDTGLRKALQRHDRTFGVGVSRTIAATPAKAWQAWSDPALLSKWFTTAARQDFRVGGQYSNADGDTGKFLKIVPRKLLRFTWEQKKHTPGSAVEVLFTPKPGGRVTVRLEHLKLATKAEADDLKQGWSWALDSLTSFLETGKKITWEEWNERTAAKSPARPKRPPARGRTPARKTPKRRAVVRKREAASG